jgi:hypothetical protein
MNPEVLRHLKHGVDNWVRGNFKSLMKYYREDAVLSSPFAPHISGAENSWLQGHEEISTHFALMKSIHPKMKCIDVLVGTTFIVILMSDGRRFLCLQIEPDDEGMVRRVIVCRSASQERNAITRATVRKTPRSPDKAATPV